MIYLPLLNMFIEECIDKLLVNLPPPPKNPRQIDLVMNGGAFNGSYLIGCLYFLKRLEKLKHVTIRRISGCSISSFLGTMYLLGHLESIESSNYYQTSFEHFKKHKNFNFLLSVDAFLPEIVDCSLLSKKMYITYINMHDMKQVVVNKFKNKQELCECIIRSSFVPCFINGDLLYKNKYIDGFLPFLFQPKKGRKILYLNIFFKKMNEMINIKNESTNYARILYGLVDIHTFFIKGISTQICSYVNDWNILDKSMYFIKLCLINCVIYFIFCMKPFYYFSPNQIVTRMI
jgi:hypothetical protein